MANTPQCELFNIGAESFAKLVGFCQKLQYRRGKLWGFSDCKAFETAISAYYYHTHEVVLDTPNGVRKQRELVRTRFTIDREHRTLHVYGRSSERKRIVERFQTFAGVRFTCQSWKLALDQLIDALPSVLGKFDLFAGTLPKFMAQDGMQGGGRLVFLDVGKAQELIQAHAGKWTAIELKGKFKGYRRIKITRGGRIHFYQYPRGEEPDEFDRAPIEELFKHYHDLLPKPLISPLEARRAELARRDRARREAIKNREQAEAAQLF